MKGVIMKYNFTRKELKSKNASDFKEGDVIKVSRYYVSIKYGNYDSPALCSYHEDKDFKPCGCTPGCDRPYYIDDFLNR